MPQYVLAKTTDAANTLGTASWVELSVTPGGAAGPISGSVWVVYSAQAASSYPNGLRYVPLENSGTDWIEFQTTANVTGELHLSLVYAMSGANPGTVQLRVDSLLLGDAGDPTTALTTGTPFTVTPGSNVTIHTVDDSDSADLLLDVTAGQIILVRITRLDTAAHTGDMRVLELRGS